MAAPVPPGAPRQQAPPPPQYNPNFQQNPDSLSSNMQNLNLNRPPSMPYTAPRPSPFAQSPSFPSSSALSPQLSRPGPSHPGVIPRPSGPPSGSPPPTFQANTVPGRPTAPPTGQPLPFSSRPPPGSFSGGPGVPPSGVNPSSISPGGPLVPPPGARPSPFASSSPLTVPPSSVPGSLANGPSLAYGGGALPSGPRFPPPTGSAPQQLPLGPIPAMGLARGPPQAPSMRHLSGSSGISAPSVPLQPAASPFSAPPQGVPPFSAVPQGGSPYSAVPQGGSPFSAPPQGGSPFSAPPQSVLPPQGPPFGGQAWPARQVAPPPTVPGSVQPPTIYGMPSPLPHQPMTAMSHAIGQSGSPMAGTKIDRAQIPRPVPNSSSVVLHDTRQGNQANIPPPASSEYIVRDTGNCSPRYMRCTINQIPCTGDLLTTSGMQLALMVQPLAVPHPAEEPIQVVDFGDCGPVRCSRCKGYINPFMKFIDQGKRFICNLCGFTDETPREYHCNLGPDGRRRDADERPELCRGTVEFVATKEYMVRDPMPAVYFFLIDVSMNAVQIGATAAACSAITQVITDLPEGPRTMVGIATFDSTIHFYNLKRALQQPLMLIVPDVQDVYTPLQTDVIVQLSECRQHLELLLESIPSMFQNNRTAESAFGASIKAASLAMKSSGGKLLVFQSVLPSLGLGALSAREADGRSNISAGDKEAHKLLQPADKTLKTMAIELAEYQVCVDLFITTQTYVDIASVSVIPRTTGGQVYFYYPFSALSDPAKLYNDLRWNITRPQGFEAVMRVRCSQGIQVQEYHGNFCKHIPTDVDLPGIDCDKSIMVTLKHDDKLQDGSECSFQCALLYTTVYGQRRIRVTTLSLPCTSNLSNLFRSADLDTQVTCFVKQAANEVPSSPLLQVREQMTNLCISTLLAYRKFCATVSSSGQLILPEALKLLPLYTLALIKSTGLRTDGRIDDRSFWINYVSSLPTPLVIPLVYPRMVAIHDLDPNEEDGSLLPAALPLSSENVSDEGIYLLENGVDAFIYIGNSVDSDILGQLFGISSVDEIPTQFVLQQYDNPLSKKLNDTVNEIRRQRCSYLRLRLCRKGDPSGMLFLSYLIEDKNPTGGLSYVEFLIHVHRQIQIKMS
ncbi:Gelsolin domain-containing protein/zf-Sec23_Sec24 domain-containing protein/Sec23_trunk domain-containing protein/Sec23_helical domain-containing protein/Sec23_BS domain-containing protein [Cephalotus follicularis]|uniref:Gelsolin domain-containing protein/zf-Sec23_Sec24 domain-containing protein/Sec23_trunk domain-containing protein/Sec23_helical domain-containing protein/Sec23_BS domain-containing protein n=1 Tax=Cephalotus follicularis TaxID=3775 RepID=A0A1Q3DD85_CEPFO|nr:Gelsolin domain-containing protein/zf-Sec23_Sec24 domain-containing protein/Sec23_trunk domain-containing protein/Sec23_helical domain-containing protein/Sec23_BS domain-containing protein [Cephalotus follicularis]